MINAMGENQIGKRRGKCHGAEQRGLFYAFMMSLWIWIRMGLKLGWYLDTRE